ncbi:hypothetical protein F5Y16DRAFT_105851 [Xylariaceae sp. FL0255]|nr:hypothetical protein F5Y16DRAFT_105851 [Xylariaceae sp. FL0255]
MRVRMKYYEEIYSEYLAVQDEFITNANKWLAKMKRPRIEKNQDNDPLAMRARMEQACSAMDAISSKDKHQLPNSPIGKVKRAFRKLCKNAGAGKVVSSLIPDDMFGSVLSSSLDIIFKALEETEVLREAVLKALERIPRILEDHEEYTQWADDDKEVHRRTAKLYTNICRVLNHILKWYTTHALAAAAKRLLNPTAFSKELSDLMAAVALAAKDVKTRGTQVMLKRIDQGQDWLSHEGIKMARQLSGMEDILKRQSERSLSYEDLERIIDKAVQTHFPQILAQSFQSLQIKNIQARELSPVADLDSILEEFCYDRCLITNDTEALLRKCLSKTQARLDADRLRSIKDNPRMRAWLTVDESSMLLVNARSDAQDLSSSCLAAHIVQSLLHGDVSHRESMVIIPLAYFCSQHINYSYDVAASPSEMVMSILLQLIEGYGSFSLGELQVLDKTDPHNIDDVCIAFGQLVAALPKDVTIYLVIEGISRFSIPAARQMEMHRAIEGIVGVYRRQQQINATFKVAFMTATRARDMEDFFEEDEILNAPTIPKPRGRTVLSNTHL